MGLHFEKPVVMFHFASTLFDPACGSNSFFQEVHFFYNKQAAAHLAAAEPQTAETESGEETQENSAQQAPYLPSEFFWVFDFDVAASPVVAAKAPLFSRDQHISIAPVPPAQFDEWLRTELLPSTKGEVHYMTSPAFDLCSIDTLHLMLPVKSIRFRSDHRLTISHSSEEGSDSVLFETDDGALVTGKKARWSIPNSKRGGTSVLLHLEISRLKRGWVDGNDVVCTINFSLEGWLGRGDNSWPLPNRTSFMRAIQQLQDALCAIGVLADLREAKVTRCDLNRSVSLDYPVAHYTSLFKALDVPRTRKIDYDETGALFSNKSQGFLIYDKCVLMERMGLATDHMPPNAARFEWQVKRARNVRNKLGISTVQDLFDGWYGLTMTFDEYVGSIFHHDFNKLRAGRPRLDRQSQTPIQIQIANLLRWCKKRALTHDLTPETLEKMVRAGNVRRYAAHVQNVRGMDRKYASRAVRQMHDALWQEQVRNPDFERNCNEIRKKFKGGQCWPYLNIQTLKMMEERSVESVYRGPGYQCLDSV